MNILSEHIKAIRAISEELLESSPENLTSEELQSLYEKYSLFYELITDFRHINFTSLFSRMVFARNHYQINGILMYHNHRFRRLIELGEYKQTDMAVEYERSQKVLLKTIHEVSAIEMPSWVNDYMPEPPGDKQFPAREYKRVLRVILTGIETLKDDKLRVIYCPEDNAHQEETAILGMPVFVRQLKKLCQYIPLPQTVSLIDLKRGESGLEFSSFVFKPDFLIGVTSISECYQGQSALAISSLSRKLIPIESSVYLLMGNLVNYALDELVHNGELEFEDMLRDIFTVDPVAFAGLEDEELREFLVKLKTHFNNLKRVVNKEMSEIGIDQSRSFLEPSFYSNEYGIQGRLDLYHGRPKEMKSDIVELKSGKLFRPNGYGLNDNHYLQTLLYDLLLESVHENKVKSNNYILYSGLEERNLRYAPHLRSRQMEAMHVRNDIILIEEVLCSDDVAVSAKLLSYFHPDRIDSSFSFLKRDAEKFNFYYNALSPLEKKYYLLFLSFINREYAISKTGEHGLDGNKGLASLWLKTQAEKEEQFSIISNMRIRKNEAAGNIPVLELGYSEKSSSLSRFRKGDIAVLYPDDGSANAVLHHQIFKCTIINIDSEGLVLRLRARQKNHELFDRYEFWHLENDTLDSSFNKQFQGLFEFIKSPLEVRRKILCLEPPALPARNNDLAVPGLSETQNLVFQKAISARDYFLIWGPPGTGKTSMMIRALTNHYYSTRSKKILLLAYTNRAVDEICASIEKVCGQEYLRIGSRYSCDERFADQLLSTRMENIANRKDLKDLLDSCRVFVSTISSFHGKSDLRRMINFDIAIVDEASQVLEPMLVGLLSDFEKYILIGDHKQLPAVVSQKPETCIVDESHGLSQTGLRDRSMSLFERVFIKCRDENWEHAYGILNEQGRMHRHILNFVSPMFYENQLTIFDSLDRLHNPPSLKGFDSLSEFLIKNRMIFVDTPTDEKITRKVNRIEAKLVAIICNYWKEIYAHNQIAFEQDSLGVITPFRSQIAVIKKLLNGDDDEKISVDTVERYQGGARERIIISIAVSKAQMLQNISNISDEGIDRKLNVALTRARENVIIFGTEEVLRKNNNYRALIDYCQKLRVDQIMKSG